MIARPDPVYSHAGLSAMTPEEQEREAAKEQTCYALGLAALQFFCFSGEEQVASWQKVAQQALPRFFPDITEVDHSYDYFFGVACVFIAYWGFVRDASLVAGVSECEALFELHVRFGPYMFENSAADWSESTVLDERNAMWGDLRKHAKLALQEIGKPLPPEPPTFIIAELISPYDFGGIGPAESWESVAGPEI